MPATTYHSNQVLDYSLRQEGYTISTWYVGLWTADPTASGLLSGEVTAADYQRKAVTWSGTNDNAQQIDWAPATSNWGNVTYIALTDNATKNTGNVLVYAPTTQTFIVNTGVPLTIVPAGLVLAVT